ncbi:hypothetical protein, partial [Sphingomonas koreensis]|uniref:hypothetical protein n=1 Tax=Sphingomonas koreensis TaxID=93064 RepID=UPI001003E5C4
MGDSGTADAKRRDRHVERHEEGSSSHDRDAQDFRLQPHRHQRRPERASREEEQCRDRLDDQRAGRILELGTGNQPDRD